MGDIQIWGFSIDAVSIVASLAVLIIPALFGLVVTALLGAQMVPAARKLVLSARKFVDQPTDSAVKFLADQLGVTEDQVIAALTKVIDEMGKEPVIVPAPANTPLLPPAPETRAPDAPVEAVP